MLKVFAQRDFLDLHYGTVIFIGTNPKLSDTVCGDAEQFLKKKVRISGLAQPGIFW